MVLPRDALADVAGAVTPHDRRVYSAAAVVRAFGGIATRAQILAAGLTGSDIAAAVRRVEIRRVRRAYYATADAAPAATDAVRVGGRLCGVSAARSYGLWAGLDEAVHVALARNASRLRVIRGDDSITPDVGERRVELHWIDTAPNRECWRVSLHDCLRQVVAWSDRETAMATLDTALDTGIVTHEELRRMFAGESLSSRLLAAAARPGSGSGYESIVVRRLEGLALRIRQQVQIAGVGRVDAVIEDILVLEIDSVVHHLTREAFEEDRRRDAVLATMGIPHIRLSTIRIRDDWDGCVADILETLRIQEPQGVVVPESPLVTTGIGTRHSSPASS